MFDCGGIDTGGAYMSTWKTEYKCRRCGAVFNGLCGGPLVYHDVISASMGMPVERLGGQIEMVDVHACRDNGVGIGDLIGCKEHEE